MPGRLDFEFRPTVINGVDWFPTWPDVPDTENRCGDCFSLDTFMGVSPPLPLATTTTTLTVIRSRGQTKVIQLPSVSNDFTLIIEFDDNPPSGAD